MRAIAAFSGFALGAVFVLLALRLAPVAAPGGTPASTSTSTSTTTSTSTSTTGAAQAAAPAAPSLCSLADGSALYADAAGRLFHLRPSPEGLTLAAVYALRPDRGRHATDPVRRAAHGFYLDDLGTEAAAALAQAREGFLRETRSGAVDAEANARAERFARAVLEGGDALLLIEALKDPKYGTRRAAALVLGEAGFREARPVLGEVATEQAGPGPERARRALEGLR